MATTFYLACGALACWLTFGAHAEATRQRITALAREARHRIALVDNPDYGCYQSHALCRFTELTGLTL